MRPPGALAVNGTGEDAVDLILDSTSASLTLGVPVSDELPSSL